MRKWLAVIAGSLAALAALVSTIPAAALNTFSPTPLGAWRLTGGAGRAVALSSGVAYIGGDFTGITDGTTTLARQHLVAVTEADGHAVAGFVADTDGTVNTVAVVGSQLYLGGTFTTVNGQARKNLARVNLPSGAVDTSFKLDADNTVFDLWLQGSRLYVGGDFKVLGTTARTRIAALDTTTGTIIGGFAPNVDRRVSSVAATTGAGGDTVYVGGRLKTVNGQTVLNLAAVNGNSGALLPVRFLGVEAPDPATTTSDILDLDIAPDGRTLFVGIGGQHFNVVGAWDTTTGARNWWHGFDATDHLDGDVQGIVYDDGRLYFGFHGGYNGNNTKRLMVADAACGTLDAAFQPSTNGIAGVVDVAADGGVLAAVGDFTGVSGVTLGGLALFPRTGPPPPPPTTCSPTTTTTSQPTTTAGSSTTSSTTTSSTTTSSTTTTSTTSSTTTSSTTTSSTTTSSTTTSTVPSRERRARAPAARRPPGTTWR